MSEPIVYVDTSRIRDGKREQLESAMQRLAAFIEANNPRVLSYRFFLDEADRTMSVVAVHPDTAALELHMEVGDAQFRTFADLVELTSIEVYGDVSNGVRQRLAQKAEMLGDGRVTVHQEHAGFVR